MHGNAACDAIHSASPGARAGEGPDQFLDGTAVVREVVAADDVERACAGASALVERRDEETDRRHGRAGVLEIVADVRVPEVEPAGRRIVAVALLGHGQRYDSDARIHHCGDEVAPLRCRIEDTEDGSDDPGSGAGRAPRQQRVEEVLRRQRVPRIRPA